MTDGYAKGQKFTREICRKLERFTGIEFRVRPTLTEPLDGWEVKGDIAHRDDASFPWVVECKKIEPRKNGRLSAWDITGPFEQPAWPIWEWWEQCEAQAGKYDGKRPLLIFSANRKKTYAMLCGTHFDALPICAGAAGPTLHIHCARRGHEVVIVCLDDLAEKLRKTSRRKK